MRARALVLIACVVGSVAALQGFAGCGGGDSGGTGGAGASSSTQGTGAGHTSSGTHTGTGAGGSGGGPPTCASEAWATYGHDAQRTFASDGCVDGPLTVSWSYVPEPPAGRMFGFTTHGIASKDAAYLMWAATDPPYTGTTAIDKVSTKGKRIWTWDSGTDSNLGHWISLWKGLVVVNDDGFVLLKDTDGTVAVNKGVDWWGQTVPDPARLYLVNVEHVDGPGIFVGAFDEQGTAAWQANAFGNCRIDAGDEQGGLALDGGVLFYAPQYSFGDGPVPTFVSGVYAFEGAHGTPKWMQPTTPLSSISAQGGKVFLVEQTASGPALTARKQTDGTIAWQKPLASVGAQAPVLAEGLVIVAHDSSSIEAFDAATGKSRWSSMVMGVQPFQSPLMFSGGCVNGVGAVDNPTTTLAAALASETLVATGADGVHVLKLADGSETWSGVPTGAMLPLRDLVIVGSKVYAMDGAGALIELASP